MKQLVKFEKNKILNNLKLQIFFVSAALLYFIRMVFPDMVIIGDYLALTCFVFFTYYLIGLIKKKNTNAINVVVNIGILTLIILLIVSFFTKGRQESFLESAGAFIYDILLVCTSSLLFVYLRSLYLLRQNKEKAFYFNAMTLFFLLSAITVYLPENLKFISISFTVVSITIIVINTFRISWLVYLVKKEKLYLLGLSIVEVIVMSLLAAKVDSGKDSVEQFIFLIGIYGITYFTILFFTTLFHLPTAEAMDKRNQEISSLQYFSSLINQVLDFNDLSETVSDISLKICNASASFTLWKMEHENYKITSFKNIDYFDAELLKKIILEKHLVNFQGNTKIVEVANSTPEQSKEKKNDKVSISLLKTQNLIKGLVVTIKKHPHNYDEEDISALNTFSDFASVAFENFRLLKESIEKERLEKELDVARDIQRKIIPTKLPDIANLEISSVFIPAFEVGGDYYDFFKIDEDRYSFIIADVSGKGISAAFIMAELKGIFISLSKIIHSPKEMLISVNKILKKTLDRKNFVSASYGVINLKEKKLTLARAGHCPALIMNNHKFDELNSKGIGLGLEFSELFDNNLEEIEYDLENNDIIILYTDGITEAKDQLMNDFGYPKFKEVLLENINKDVDEISSSVLNGVSHFSSNANQYDDITLLVIKWKDKNKNSGEIEWQNSVPQLSSRVK